MPDIKSAVRGLQVMILTKDHEISTSSVGRMHRDFEGLSLVLPL